MLKELPLRMHHHAYAVKDQEANRHYAGWGCRVVLRLTVP
jgi:hypothetical protein